MMAAALNGSVPVSQAADLRPEDVPLAARAVAAEVTKGAPPASSVVALYGGGTTKVETIFEDAVEGALRERGFAVARSAVAGSKRLTYRASSDAAGAIILLDLDGVKAAVSVKRAGSQNGAQGVFQ